MRKKAIIRAIVLIGIAIIIFGSIYLSLYVIGNPVDGNQVFYEMSVNDENLELRVSVKGDSATAFRGWTHKQDNGTVYIDARKVLVSKLSDSGDYKTSVDLTGVDKVVLGGKAIWERENDT